jgi:hypothetical protein
MELKMYLAYDGTLMIHQVNQTGKDLFFQVDISRGYNTNESDLDNYEDEADYFKALKQSIANKFNLEKES